MTVTRLTTVRRRGACAALGTLLLAGGCAQLRAANATPPAPMEGKLTSTLQEADREAQALRFGMADRLLADFAESHANTPEAVETQYWRAVFRLDPSNQTARPRDAIALLDGYLAGNVTVAHRGAALALRRAALSLDRPAPALVTGSSSAPDQARPDAKPSAKNDDEVQRLKEELAKANAELERIKKRLAQPNP
jgi:hypothetical protein